MAALAAVLTVVVCARYGQAADRPGRSIRVETSRTSFNPSLRESVTIRVTTIAPGELSCAVIDRDGYVVRQFAKPAAAAGSHVFEWDGRDELAAVVADEAYSLLVRLNDGRGNVDTYAPAIDSNGAHAVSSKIDSYDRGRGVIAYRLPNASRVHLQAGTAKPDQKGKPQGVAMVNIVDSEPRPAGSVVEHWIGYDASRIVYVPGLPHFVLAMVAAPLPENAIITTGNSARTFIAQARSRRGASILPASKAAAHHSGLAGTEDRAPTLTVAVRACAPAAERWQCSSAPKHATATLGRGDYLDSFCRQRRTLQLYVDGDLVAERRASGASESLPIPALAPGSHLLTMNWVSVHGPLATASLRINISAKNVTAARKAGGR